jgi:hypothetical protein
MKQADGYYLRTTKSAARHRLAGPRSTHADIQFPLCPRCLIPYSPVLRIDFDDPRLVPLGLWTGELVTFVCHNDCQRWSCAWDYSDRQRPVVFDLGITDDVELAPGVELAQDYEFEPVGLELAPRVRDPAIIDVESRIGGEPAWLQGNIEVVGDEVVFVDPPVHCPRCARAMPMLAQWSESGMAHIPRRLGRPQELMGNPFIRFWFGCAPCKIVLTLYQLD